MSKQNALVALATGVFVACAYFTASDLTKTVDYVLFYKSNFRFLHDALVAGRIPWWNPYVGLGRPFLADSQNAVFYPPAYLLVTGPKTGLFLFVWTHTLLAVLGMRRLFRALGLGELAGCFAGFVFIMIAPVSARWFTGQILYAAAICYVPLLFAFAVELDGKSNGPRLFLHAMLFALQFLCGHPQVFWLSVLGQGIFLLIRSLCWRWRDDLIRWGMEIGSYALVLIWTLFLIAVALAPFLELISHGNRAHASAALAASGSMSWTDFASLVATGSREEINWEKNLYVGFPIFLAGALGLSRWRDRNIRAMGGVLLIGLLVSLGDRLPTFPIFFHLLPGFAKFRVHSRAGLLVCFALVVGAGIVVGRPPRWLVFGWNKGLGYSLKHLFTAFAGVTALTLLVMLVGNKRSYGPDSAGAGGRGYPFQQVLMSRLRESGLLLGPAPPRVLVPSFLVPPNLGMELRYRSPDAYTSLFLQRPWNYLHRALNLTASEEMNSFLPMEVFERGPFPYKDLDLALGYDPQSQSLVLNSNAFPTAMMVYGIRVCSKSSDVFEEAKKMDLKRVALLESGAGMAATESAREGDPVRVARYGENDVVCEVDAKAPGVLVLNEAWYPGWKCIIDGKVTQSFPANGWMRGFRMPAGKRSVHIYFQQNYLGLGAGISAFGLLMGLAAIYRRRRIGP